MNFKITQIQNYTMFIVVLLKNNAVLQHLHVHFLLYGVEFYHNIMKLDINLKNIYTFLNVHQEGFFGIIRMHMLNQKHPSVFIPLRVSLADINNCNCVIQ